jgi:hypothetical protein
LIAEKIRKFNLSFWNLFSGGGDWIEGVKEGRKVNCRALI